MSAHTINCLFFWLLSYTNNENIQAAMDFSELGITSDIQLYELAKQIGLPKINYIGFSENLRKLPKNGLSIINLGDDQQGGTHWTMLWVEDGHITYFDSYGVGPEDPIIQLAGTRRIAYNTKQVQGFSESFCGVWALCAAAFIAKKKDKAAALNEFVDQFQNMLGS